MKNGYRTFFSFLFSSRYAIIVLFIMHFMLTI